MKEALIGLTREGSIYAAASAIAFFMSQHFPLPLGEKASAIGFAIAGGLGGVWFGRKVWRRRFIPALAFVLFCATGAMYLLMCYFFPDPPYPFILAEIVVLGCASFCFFWIATGAGFDLSKSKTNQ